MYKKGDVHPETGMVYWDKDKSQPSGARWCTQHAFDKRLEGQKHSLYTLAVEEGRLIEANKILDEVTMLNQQLGLYD